MSFTLPLQGHRREDRPIDDIVPDDPQPGDFWKDSDDRRLWWVFIPGGPIASIANHHVEEHEDGMITVVPGPWGSNSIPGPKFHGYINHGVWDTSP